MSDSNQKPDKVEIYHRANRLKLKAGAESIHDGDGYIDPRSIDRAQTVIDKKATIYKNEVEQQLVALEKSWDGALAAKTPEQAGPALEELYHHANHIKDLAATFNYQLMQHFGFSLREFAEKIDISNKAHHTIVQAHIDVMWVVYHENIKDDGGPKAKELKKIVAQAIEQYS